MKKRCISSLLLLLALLLVLPTILAEAPVKGNVTKVNVSSLETQEQAAFDPSLLEIEPYAPEGMDKAIIGADDRKTITNVFKYPFSAISYLEVEAYCGCDPWVASGFMISKNVMLTAAHCLVCQDHGRLADEITAYFGYKNARNYQVKYDGGMTFWVGTTFYQGGGKYGYDHEGMTQDYAYIKLDRNIGDKTGWFGWRVHKDSDFGQTPVCVTGYRDNLLKMDYGYTYEERYSDDLMTYYIDIVAGNSGCPVYTYDYYALGINIAEARSGEVNYGRRLTPSLVRSIHQDTD